LTRALDARGRLVAETNVRRIAENLGLNKDTVTKYLRRLREYGLVLQEEARDDASGRYETSRYVLDPSACLERFTHTPGKRETAGIEPCPKPSDTVPAAPMSEDAGHGGHRRWWFRHLQRDVVVASQEEQQQQAARDVDPELRRRLLDLGVAARVADDLLDEHATDRVSDVLDAVGAQTLRSPAGWVVKALRDGWDVSELVAEQRRAQAGEQRRVEHAAAAAEADRAEREQSARADAWAAAVSAALDDHALTEALDRTTTPTPGLNRRSAPLASAQLVAWAVATHRQSPEQPLDRALAAALAAGAEPVPHVAGDLPAPPAPPRVAPDLSARVRACLDRLPEPAIAGATSNSTSRREHR